MNCSAASPISVYVHIPYCLRKCPYCDFCSIASPPEEDDYTEAVCAELRWRAAQSDWHGRACCSVFFGGGTPSLFSEHALLRVLDSIRYCFPPAAELEVTLEANPASLGGELNAEKLRSLRRGGFNRLSLGAQSFSDPKLAFLGRVHSAADTRRSIEEIRLAGFDNLSLDLIFGAAGEKAGDWEQDLRTALGFLPQHLSLYGLTIEPQTEFGRQAGRGALLLAEEEESARMYETAAELLGAHKLKRYEISNFAAPGFECRHNAGYWSRRDYLGLGAGAHSFAGRRPGQSAHFGQRWANVSSPGLYMQRARDDGTAVESREKLSKEQAELEFFFLGLRQTIGILVADYRHLFGQPLSPHLQRLFQTLADQNLCSTNADCIRLTEHGFLFSDSVFSAIADTLTPSP